jgi:hypothetical protein
MSDEVFKAIEAKARKGVLAGSDAAKLKDDCLVDILTMARAQEVPQSNDIKIYWGNKATYNRHKVAIEVQDAGNLRALAREFVKVVDTASDATQSTEATWSDAAVVMFVNKFESLCHSEERFSAAYKVCQEKAGA